MDTIRLNKGATKMVAHRGVSGLELENTCAAFVAAGNRSYFGVETDVHVTADGQFIIIHDDNTGRVAEQSLPVEESSFASLRSLQLRQKDGSTRIDLRLPSLEEYLDICQHYDKTAVLELKNPMPEEAVRRIVQVCERVYSLEKMIFISFDLQNLLYLRQATPQAAAQFLLMEAVTEKHMEDLARNRLGLDVHYRFVSRELVETLHAKGIEVNCWTVDDPQWAEKLANWGVDYITSNILE